MMALALAEARKGWGATSPNPMVGAVVAQGDRVIAKGYHARAGGPHAEAVALAKAGNQARGASIYVTLEPCNHHGRTPPCTEAILAAGIKRVTIAQMDPNPHVTGGGAAYLAGRGLEVVTGVLEERARELNECFNRFITSGKPFVILKSAATLDGKLATAQGHSRWITGEKARQYVHRIRHGVDAILVGRNTVAQDDPTLNTRLPGGKKGRDPIRVVLDTRLQLSPAARVFDPKLGGRTIAACGPDHSRNKRNVLENGGVTVWELPLRRDRVSLTALVDRLGRENVTSLLIEGGAEVNASALITERIADKVLFFYAPKVVGGREAPTLVGGAGVPAMSDALNVRVNRIRRLGPDLLIEAYPEYGGALDLFSPPC